MKNEKSCGAFVFDGNRVLIIKQRTGDYGFPKGHVEEGETEEQTAIREVKEETGVDIEILSNKRYYTSYIKNETINKEVVYYLVKLINKDNESRQEEEISEIIWVDIEKAESVLTFDNMKELWNEAKNDFQNK